MHTLAVCMQETVAAVVWALAFEQEYREAVVAAGGIPSLINLCATLNSSAVQEHAAGGGEQLHSAAFSLQDLTAVAVRTAAVPRAVLP
jgi:hypothetical protein